MFPECAQGPQSDYNSMHNIPEKLSLRKTLNGGADGNEFYL